MKPKEVKLVKSVEIMTKNKLDVKATTHSVVVQISGATQNGINLNKRRFLVNVVEVFDSILIVQFPTISIGRRCKCGSKEHRLMRSLDDVTTLRDVCINPFNIIETSYRL